MKLALKIDVSTVLGVKKGVPALMTLLRQYEANASFMFSLGPARHKNFLARALLPTPDLSRRSALTMQAVQNAGFDVALQCWDNQRWQAQAATATPVWIESTMRQAHTEYEKIMGRPSAGVGAAGWQMNAHALRMTQRLDYQWASDCRGSHPFVPVWHAELVLCPQLPTTLPTLDELIGTEDLTVDNVHQRLNRLTAIQIKNHVFQLNAEREGLALLEVMPRLLEGWLDQGYELVSLSQLRETLDIKKLPRHEVIIDTMQNTSSTHERPPIKKSGKSVAKAGSMLMQGEEFLLPWKETA
ncbi:MAG: 4-deoxy-4-formamido-L-arabinose-phosphoundecaprenol deformylase [Rugosibacter sp.]|nr:4-deoxy-4-formamido-L-arabinose-phosphoundecaprenol deformylase [Rugosibacter sp.]